MERAGPRGPALSSHYPKRSNVQTFKPPFLRLLYHGASSRTNRRSRLGARVHGALRTDTEVGVGVGIRRRGHEPLDLGVVGACVELRLYLRQRILVRHAAGNQLSQDVERDDE